MSVERPAPVLPRQLVQRARTLDPQDPHARLQALWCLDAARWLAWPDDEPEAAPLEQRLLAEPRPEGDADAAGWGVVAADARARGAVAAASPESGFEAAAEAIEALPAGYAHKSLWLRWHDLCERTRRADAWALARRRLAARLRREGVPPSELPPVLAGQLDLERWRAEGRLMAELAGRVQEMLADAEAGFASPGLRRTYTAATGRYLLVLGAEETGAKLLFDATDDLPLRHSPPQGRLYSRPTPPAAVWLRRAVQRASLVRGDERDGLLHHGLVAYLLLALRHRAWHLLAETFKSPPDRFERPDINAVVLATGALAWLACGDRWRGWEWLATGLRIALRHPRTPRVGEAGLFAARWIQQTHDLALLDSLAELSTRLVGIDRVEVRAEVARLHALLGHRDRGWEVLRDTYRQVQTELVERQVQGVAACAATLMAWNHIASGLNLMRRGLTRSLSDQSGILPGKLPSQASELAVEREQLASLFGRSRIDHEAAAPVMRALLRYGEVPLAQHALQTARHASDAIEQPAERLRAYLFLSRQLADAVDLDLRAALDQAVADEAAALMQRLRSEDRVRL